jgi:hypothetical protein
MADNELIPSGQAYAYSLLEKWEETLELGEKVRFDIMTEGKDNKVRQMFIAKLLILRLALYPKVHGNLQMGELQKRYEALKDCALDPVMFSKKENSMRIFELEEVIAETLEKLGITKYEK